MRPRPGPLSIRTRLTAWYAGILFTILVVVSILSYSLLRWNLIRDVDVSLTTVARVMRDTGYAGALSMSAASAEAAIREILGPEFHDKLFQVVDPHGTPGARSAQLRDVLPLSSTARSRAARGRHTFETIRLAMGERVRLVTLPILENGQLARLLQVGMSLERVDGALARYLQILLVLVPFALGLAAVGGTLIAGWALLVDVLDTGVRLAQGTGVTLRLARVTPAVIPGDGSALRRVILNLVENAVKYTAAGGYVELSLELADGQAIVRVRDTGVGIGAADLERIFQPFVRLDPACTRASKGAGLGLAIARSIVLAHGGNLSVESMAGTGSTFTVRLLTT